MLEKAQVEGLSKPKMKILVWRESTRNEGRKGVGCRRHWDGSMRYSKRVKTSSLQEP